MRRVKQPAHMRVKEATGAFAGLAVAVAAATKAAAAALAPSGLAAVAIAIGFKSPPMLLKAVPIVLGICAAAGIIAGLARFYAWYKTPSE